MNGQQLGYLGEHVTRAGDPSGLADRMDSGDRYTCRIGSLTGGSGATRDVNIEITASAKEESSANPISTPDAFPTTTRRRSAFSDAIDSATPVRWQPGRAREQSPLGCTAIIIVAIA
jgi:hypothetical protein